MEKVKQRAANTVKRVRKDLSDDGDNSENDESANEHESDDECSACEDMIDDEEIVEDNLDYVASAVIAAASAPSMNTRAQLLSRASAAYTYPVGIEFAPESNKLMKGKNLLLCTSLGWSDGASPTTGSVKSSGVGCARNAEQVSYGRLKTDVIAKKINTNLTKEARNIVAASAQAKQSWQPIPKGYDKVRYAMFNGGVGGNNLFGNSTLRMRQLTTGVVEHEYYHGEGLQHANRWRKLDKGEKKKNRRGIDYKLINGEWHIFEPSRDGFSTMSIYGTQRKLTVPQMEQVSYEFGQLALYSIGIPSIIYNIQDVMGVKRDGVVNGVKIMLENEPPIYLGRYASKVKNSKNIVEDSNVLAFHTAVGEKGTGSTRWMLGTNGLYFSDVRVYARVVDKSNSEVWQVEVGRITEEVSKDRHANIRLKL